MVRTSGGRGAVEAEEAAGVALEDPLLLLG
jgi:hypothetical protein